MFWLRQTNRTPGSSQRWGRANKVSILPRFRLLTMPPNCWCWNADGENGPFGLMAWKYPSGSTALSFRIATLAIYLFFILPSLITESLPRPPPSQNTYAEFKEGSFRWRWRDVHRLLPLRSFPRLLSFPLSRCWLGCCLILITVSNLQPCRTASFSNTSWLSTQVFSMFSDLMQDLISQSSQ